MEAMKAPPSPYQIAVQVESVYVEEQSEPEANRYFFAYRVVIRNEGMVAAQLKSRHWVITDANGRAQEVRGEGVVGEQPYLEPGQGFHYTSGVMLETPVGSMYGNYQMLASDGVTFDAEIRPFRLAVRELLH
jgi:ApaG protein